MVRHAFEKGHKISVFTTLYGMKSSDVDYLKTIKLQKLVIHFPDLEGKMKIKVDQAYLDIVEQVHNTDFDTKVRHYMVFGKHHPEVQNIIGRHRSYYFDTRSSNIDDSLKTPPEAIKGPLICTTGRQFRNVLLPNGEVTLCCMDYGLKHIIGNLLENNYSSLHRGRRFRNVMEMMQEDSNDLLYRTCEDAAKLLEGDVVETRQGHTYALKDIVYNRRTLRKDHF